jgi:hypothetical protein
LRTKEAAREKQSTDETPLRRTAVVGQDCFTTFQVDTAFGAAAQEQNE